MSEKLNIFADTGCPSLELLTGYLEDRLPPGQRQQLERHMLDCPMCADALEGLESVADRQHIKGAVLRIRTESKRRLYEQNPYRDKSSKRRYRAMPRHFTQYAASAAAAIFIFWMGVFIYRDLNQAQTVYEKHFQAQAAPPPSSVPPPLSDTLITAADPAQKDDEAADPLASAATPAEQSATQRQEASQPPEGLSNRARSTAPPALPGGAGEAQKGPSSPLPVTAEAPGNSTAFDQNELATTSGEAGISLEEERSVVLDDAAPTISPAGKSQAEALDSRKSESIANYSQAPNYQPQAPYQDPDMALGLERFENKNYAQALAAFEQVLTRFPDYTQAQYLAARSHIEMGQPEKSVSLLRAVIDSGDTTYYHEAQWQLSGAYLLRNKKQPAAKLLRQIEQQGGPYQEKARAALKDL